MTLPELIRAELESSFVDGPEAPTVAQALAAGHRLQRRRRLGAAAAAGAAALALLLGGVPWGLAGHRSDGGDVPAAARRAEPEPRPGPAELLDPGQLAGYAPDGTLVLRPGVWVVELVADPLGMGARGDSVGLVATRGDRQQWLLLGRTEGGGTTATWRDVGTGPASVDMWLADQSGRAKRAHTDLVGFGPGDSETLLPRAGVRLLDQQASPEMPPSFAEPAARTAVAQVHWEGDTWFVLARDPGPGAPDYLSTTAAAAGGAGTLEEFVVWARAAYALAGGAGGLR